MRWFDVAGGRLRFRGRLTREPVREWLASAEGAAAIAAAGREIRFALLGRSRVARRRVGGTLWEAIRRSTMRDAIAAECEPYMAAWSQLAYAPSLPRVTIASRRLVIVPRVMILGRTASGVAERIAAALRRDNLPDPFTAFVGNWVLDSMDAAIRRARPCPERPVHAQESWACVAIDDQFVWVDPLWSGDGWRGHVAMFEMPGPRLGRRERREVEAAIEQLTESLPALSRLQRDGRVRLANDQLASVRF